MFFAALLSAALQVSPVQTAPAPSALVRVDFQARNWNDLLPLGLEVVATNADLGTADLIADRAGLRRLREAGFRTAIVIDDLTQYYAERARLDPPAQFAGTVYGQWLTPPFGQGLMGSFYTLSEVESVLTQIHAAYPTITTVPASIGQSVEGRSQWMIKISDNPNVDENEPEVRIDSLHHAREPQSMQTNLWFMLWLLAEYGSDPVATYLVDERELYFIPVVNPDGYAYNEQIAPNGGGLWRKNRRDNGDSTHGVDLNRNYPYEWGFDDLGSSSNTSSEVYRGPSAASEPETMNMMAFMTAREFGTALSMHCSGNLWLSPWGYDEIAAPDDADFKELGAVVTELNNYTVQAGWELYVANGVTFDYEYGVHGTMAWTPEIGISGSDGFWPVPARIIPLAEENQLALARTALAAGAFVHLVDIAIADVGDGDGFVEPGESAQVTITLRNLGVLATATNIDVSIVSSSPSLVVGNASDTLLALGSFQSDSNGNALTFATSATDPSGTQLSFTVIFEYEGLCSEVESSIVLGAPRITFSDAIESADGWQTGVAGDTATTGLWEWGDPIGTDSNGQPASPEDDNTPAGTQCFVTGNGGGSGGNDDVDDGFTTLVSPRLDLSGLRRPELGYARWFADLSNADDEFRSFLSNDDGANWVALETLAGNHNAWETVSFRVDDYLEPTNAMRVMWIAEDDPNNSVLEAAVDDLSVTSYDARPRLVSFGNHTLGSTLRLHVSGEPGEPFALWVTHGNRAAGSGGPFAPFAPNWSQVASGSLDANGNAVVVQALPNDPALRNTRLAYRANVAGRPTNGARVRLE